MSGQKELKRIFSCSFLIHDTVTLVEDELKGFWPRFKYFAKEKN